MRARPCVGQRRRQKWLMPRMLRRPRTWIVFGGNHLDTRRSCNYLVWDKGAGSRADFAECEFAWFYRTGTPMF